MKIKVAILENDKMYLNRLISALSSRYSDKLELYSFSDFEVATHTISNEKINVLIVSDSYEFDTSLIPERCAFAYFVESPDIATFNKNKAICKFQMVDLIYKEILNLYSETAGNISSKKTSDSSTRVIAFSSPCGGTGTTTIAISFAKHCANIGKKVLYLNLEKYGSADIYFSGNGQLDMSDIVFAIKSKKANLAIKLESCTKQDSTGVYFFSQPKIALDLFELSCSEINEIISTLKASNTYDFIAVDMEYGIDKDTISIFNEMDSIVIVGDGSENSNTKIYRAIQSLLVREENSDIRILGKVSLVYNKFSSKTGKIIENIQISSIGGIPRYEHISEKQVTNQLSNLEVISKILD